MVDRIGFKPDTIMRVMVSGFIVIEVDGKYDWNGVLYFFGLDRSLDLLD